MTQITLQSPKSVAKLRCYYKRDRPYLKLAPIKVEIVYLSPMVALFRDVVSDYEISVIKELAQPRVSLVHLNAVLQHTQISKIHNKNEIVAARSGRTTQ
jgi:hypothetical protein